MSKNKIIAQTTSRVIQQQQYFGPIPPPGEMDKYEHVLPGAADRILKMAEQQAQHRHSIENAVITGNLKHQKSGLIVGAVITIVAIACGTILTLSDKNTAGLTTILSMIGVDAGIFVFGRLRQEKDRTQKLAKIEETKK